MLVMPLRNSTAPGTLSPPTLVVEILSPSTQRHDKVRKLRLYAAVGVKEYGFFSPIRRLPKCFHSKERAIEWQAPTPRLMSLSVPAFQISD